jgi:hypothetical protein
MMKTSNTTDLRRSSIMPGKGQLYKKKMKPMAAKKTVKPPMSKKKGK